MIKFSDFILIVLLCKHFIVLLDFDVFVENEDMMNVRNKVLGDNLHIVLGV